MLKTAVDECGLDVIKTMFPLIVLIIIVLTMGVEISFLLNCSN